MVCGSFKAVFYGILEKHRAEIYDKLITHMISIIFWLLLRESSVEHNSIGKSGILKYFYIICPLGCSLSLNKHCYVQILPIYIYLVFIIWFLSNQIQNYFLPSKT